MTTMLDKVKYSPYERQTYTKYEISNMVKQKRKKLGLSIEEFADKFGVKESVVYDIEEAKRSFNVEMYKTCSTILDITLDELLSKDIDEPLTIKFRKNISNTDDKSINETVELANMLFHEMVVQHKMNVSY